MKVLLSFRKKEAPYSFESMRYKENLKLAFEKAEIPHAASLSVNPDIAHFISPAEESKINDAYLEDLLVVISVGYAESDPKLAFFDYANNEIKLSKRSKRILKEADLILTPTEEYKNALIAGGVEAPIEIITGGINYPRYEKFDNDLKDAFLKYFRIREVKPYCLSIIQKQDKASFEAIKKIAEQAPNLLFFYIIQEGSVSGSISKSRRLQKDLPENLIVSPSIPDDIFYSGISEAVAYISLPTGTPDYQAVLQAMAAKTQVIYMNLNRQPGIFINRENVLKAANEEKVVRLLESYKDFKSNSTVKEAYELAKSKSIESMGEALKNAYQKLLKQKEG